MDQFVFIMRLSLGSRSRPTTENYNAAIAVEENTSDSESAKVVKFYCSILLHNLGVEGLALAHQKPQQPKSYDTIFDREANNPKFKTYLIFLQFCTHSG